MIYHLLIQAIEKVMDKCKVIMLSELISILITLYDFNTNDANAENNKMMTFVTFRIALTLCRDKLTPRLIVDRALDLALMSSIINNSADNSDTAISFRVVSLLVAKKWKYDYTNSRVGWRTLPVG